MDKIKVDFQHATVCELDDGRYSIESIDAEWTILVDVTITAHQAPMNNADTPDDYYGYTEWESETYSITHTDEDGVETEFDPEDVEFSDEAEGLIYNLIDELI